MGNVVAFSGYYRTKDLRAPRTMRDAGLEHIPWGKRIRPQRPGWFLIAAVAFCAAFWLGAVWLVMALA